MPSPTWPTIGASRPEASRSCLVSLMHGREVGDRDARVGGEALGSRVAARVPTRRRRGGRARGRDVRSRRRPSRSRGRRAPSAIASTSSACASVSCGVPWNSSSSVGATGSVEVEVAVDGVDLHVVAELDAGDGDRVGEHLDDGVDGGVERREGAGGGGHRLGRGLDAQRDLGDQAERALGADEQAGEVVAGGGLARSRAGADDLALRGDDGEAEDVLAHRAVADAGRSRRAGGDHAADRRVGAGVDGEEDALGPQLRVELPARHARLDGDVHVLDRQAQDLVRPGVMSMLTPPSSAATWPSRRRAGAERDDRRRGAGMHARTTAAASLRVARVDDEVRRRGRVPALVGAVALAARPAPVTTRSASSAAISSSCRPIARHSTYSVRVTSRPSLKWAVAVALPPGNRPS